MQNDKIPIRINNTSVSQVPLYKYVGVIIQYNLEWNEHITGQVKKVDQVMYYMRRLGKFNINTNVLCLFSNSVSVVSSVLVYEVSCWYNACDIEQKKEVCKFARRREKSQSNIIQDF